MFFEERQDGWVEALGAVEQHEVDPAGQVAGESLQRVPLPQLDEIGQSACGEVLPRPRGLGWLELGPAPVFAEFHYSTCTLALGHTSTARLFNNAARPAANETAIIEWMVDDVDAEYDRLKPIVSNWEQEPTLMPWGNKSILFRDPDGNLVNLFTPTTEDAIKRFRRQ